MWMDSHVEKHHICKFDTFEDFCYYSGPQHFIHQEDRRECIMTQAARQDRARQMETIETVRTAIYLAGHRGPMGRSAFSTKAVAKGGRHLSVEIVQPIVDLMVRMDMIELIEGVNEGGTPMYRMR